MLYPELDKKESVVWPFVKQLLQASFLLRELVVDLPDVHTLQQGVAVARAALADVHKQVLVVLGGGKRVNHMRTEVDRDSKGDFTPVV